MNTKPMKYQRFEVGSTCEGWEIIDTDGRPVSEEFFSQTIAQQVKEHLNKAAASGPKSLAVALGAIDEFDDFWPKQPPQTKLR